MRATTAITVRRSSEEAYRLWRDFERFPEFMTHVESVAADGAGRWHWVASAPAGRTVEWDAEVVQDTPNEVISWRSVEGSDVDSAGTVTFRAAPGDRGTEITVELEYSPPGGSVGALVAKVFGEEPTQQIKDDLRRFKQLIETGEIARSDGSPDGTSTKRQLQQDAGRPQG